MFVLVLKKISIIKALNLSSFCFVFEISVTNWEYKSEVKHSKLSFKYPPSYRKDMEEYLKKIWYDPAHPGSFAGPSKLYQVVKQEGKFNVGMSKI